MARDQHLIADACTQAGIDVPPAFVADRDAMLAELETTLREVRDGSQGHYFGAEGLAERIEHLQTFRL